MDELVARVASVGTRHRLLYSLCHKLHDALGIIVSQDVKASVVTRNDDKVTFEDVNPIDFA